MIPAHTSSRCAPPHSVPAGALPSRLEAARRPANPTSRPWLRLNGVTALARPRSGADWLRFCMYERGQA
eukprot:scaffold327591_cov63-Tisochrysis_lutea.AAC.4